jgi:chemotaxis-related protein WspB
MKAMVFHIGDERYALPLAQVLRALPAARLKALPGAPHYVPGLLDLHGEPVPVIDLSRLAGIPSDAVRYDTRILLVDVPVLGRLRRLGLQAERVAGIVDLGGALADGGVAAAPWLGKVAGAPDSTGMIQLLDPEHLLAPEIGELLFGTASP